MGKPDWSKNPYMKRRDEPDPRKQQTNLDKRPTNLPIPPDEAPPKGAFTGFRMSPTATPASQMLAPHHLRDTYRQSPHIRRAVDRIAATIGSLPWEVIPIPGKGKPNQKMIDQLFRTSNHGSETFRDILVKVATDTLVVTKGVMYVAPSLLGTPLALYSRDGASFKAVYEESGILLGYKQYASQITVFENVLAVKETPFTPAEVVFIDHAPKSYLESGEPLIEACTNDIAGALRMSSRFAFYAKRGQLPPGFIHLGKIGKDAYARAKQQMDPAQPAEQGIAVFDNVDEAEWHKFDDAIKAEYLENYKQAVTTIWVVFGLIDPAAAIQRPAESFDLDATGALAAKSELIAPIARSIQDRLTAILKDHINGEFRFSTLASLGLNDAVLAKNGGVLTPNEARSVIGLEGKEGGDELVTLNPKGLTPTGETNAGSDKKEAKEEDDTEEKEKEERAFFNETIDRLQQDILTKDSLRTDIDLEGYYKNLDTYTKERADLVNRLKVKLSNLHKEYAARVGIVSQEYKDIVELYKKEQTLPPLPGRKTRTPDGLFELHRQRLRREMIATEKELWTSISNEYATYSKKALNIGHAKMRTVFPQALRPTSEELVPFETKAVDSFFRKELKYLRSTFDVNASANMKRLFFRSLVDDVATIGRAIDDAITAFAGNMESFANGVSAFGEIGTMAAGQFLNQRGENIAFYWTSSDDQDSCIHCRAYSTQTFLGEDFSPEGPYPRPKMWLNEDYGLRCNHNCRCTLMPVEGEVRDNPIIGRSFVQRFLPTDPEATLSKVIAFTGIKLNDDAARFMGSVTAAGEARGKDIFDRFTTLRQWSYFANIDSIQVLPRAEITNLISRAHAEHVTSLLSYWVPKRGTAILIPAELSTADKVRTLVEEIGNSIATNRYDSFAGQFIGELSQIMKGIRTSVAPKLRGLLTSGELDEFLTLGTVPVTKRDLVQKVTGYSPDYFNHYTQYFRTDFADYILSQNTFMKRDYAQHFQEMLALTQFDTIPLDKYVGSINKAGVFKVSSALTGKEASTVFSTLIRNMPKRLRAEGGELLKKILAMPGFRRREYWFDADGNVMPTILIPKSRVESYYGLNANFFLQVKGVEQSPAFVEITDKILRALSTGDKTWREIINNVEVAAIAKHVGPGKTFATVAEAEKALGTAIGKAVTADFNDARIGTLGSSVIVADDVVSFAHEMGHGVWAFRLSDAQRLDFTNVFRLMVAAEKTRLETAYAAFGSRIGRTTDRDMFERGLKLLGDLSVKGEIPKEEWFFLQSKFDDMLFRNGFTKVPSARVYALSNVHEWFADMYSAYTVRPYAFRSIDPNFGSMYENFHRTHILGETLANFDSVLASKTGTLTKKVATATPATISVDDLPGAIRSAFDAFDGMDPTDRAIAITSLIERILDGEFGKVTDSVKKTLKKLMENL
jgi:hypothetical protein